MNELQQFASQFNENSIFQKISQELLSQERKLEMLEKQLGYSESNLTESQFDALLTLALRNKETFFAKNSDLDLTNDCDEDEIENVHQSDEDGHSKQHLNEKDLLKYFSTQKDTEQPAKLENTYKSNSINPELKQNFEQVLEDTKILMYPKEMVHLCVDVLVKICNKYNIQKYTLDYLINSGLL